MPDISLQTVSDDVKALRARIDSLLLHLATDAAVLESTAWWKAHLGWAVACAAAFVLGFVVHGVL